MFGEILLCAFRQTVRTHRGATGSSTSANEGMLYVQASGGKSAASSSGRALNFPYFTAAEKGVEEDVKDDGTAAAEDSILEGKGAFFGIWARP
ncbi:hypothetical protein HPP92_000558 [Vanilla planifolia]|uniref:Uncharacterized protein n=1 Tax=Vanilla planifolia TaxID=51239 RepID=A0A835S1L6_VANPL|nr:hypothetical protein HPP92_000558 [Vanilla planifolia]